MATGQGKTDRPRKGVGRTLLDDVQRGDLRKTVRTDLKDLYAFYLDDEARERLARMGWFRRALARFWWLAKSLFYNLTPARRVLLVAGILLFVVSPFHFRTGEGTGFTLELDPLGFLLILAVLMLELKDKLLAKDELAVGRAVQLALLPDESPPIPGWDVWFHTQPANDVGGDLVDALSLPGSRLALIVGDVSGKGLGAALLMAKLQATIRAVATETPSLADLGSRANAIFCRDQVAGRFATLLYLELRPDSGTVRVLNAGHLPPRYQAEGAWPELPPVAPPLGVIPGARFEEQEIVLDPGALLVAFSDGVTEARNADGEFFEDRLERLLPELRGLSAEAAGERVLEEVGAFVGEERLGDDLSLAVIRRG